MSLTFAGNQLNLVVAQTAAGSDGVTATNVLEAAQGVYNGATIDQVRGNVDAAALITLSTAVPTSPKVSLDQTNYNGRGVIVVFDMTAVGSNTGPFVLTIQGKDAASGKYYTLLAGASVTTNTTNVYMVYPGAPATANVSANAPLPRTWRVSVTTSDTTHAVSYTVGASVIL